MHNYLLPAMIMALVWLVNMGNHCVGSLTKDDQIQYRSEVFINGRDGYRVYRIPALVCSAKSVLLAFCEGRKNGHKDTGDIDLLLKRSFNLGRSWSNQMVVHEEGGSQNINIVNPVPIVDLKHGKIHLLYSKDYLEIFYTCSNEDAEIWSAPKIF
ncbi:MAG: exo-alpha-sialidase [Saprospiraceae bacterium]|nr:exo-alpha-sialidase [Saprospiraceae bacterium]